MYLNSDVREFSQSTSGDAPRNRRLEQQLTRVIAAKPVTSLSYESYKQMNFASAEKQACASVMWGRETILSAITTCKYFSEVGRFTWFETRRPWGKSRPNTL